MEVRRSAYKVGCMITNGEKKKDKDMLEKKAKEYIVIRDE